MPQRPPVTSLLVVLLGAGCQSPGFGQAVTAVAPVRWALPRGAVVRLLPAERTTAGEVSLASLDGWFREAMRQTGAFDIAAGVDEVETLPDQPVFTIELACDPKASALTTTLRSADGPPVPLFGASFASRPLVAAIDELALGTRLSLGEEPDQPTLPMALAYSPDARVVEHTERAMGLGAVGQMREAAAELLAARRLDGGSPPVLAALGAIQSVLGQNVEARALAEEGLSYQHRLSPTSLHRLGRTLQLARATLRIDAAAARDEELLALGEASLRERPHDAQGLLTAALARNFLGRFAEALPAWHRLQHRLPANATVRYHLGWAELAAGDPAAAAEAFAAAAPFLPRGAVVVPRAIALFEQGDHQGLSRFLDSLVADPGFGDGAAHFALRRILASHAILQDNAAEAGRLLLADLEWLRQRPSQLLDRAGELAETGEVLVRLGYGRELGVRLEAMHQTGTSNEALRDAFAFLGGLLQVARTGDRAEAAEASLLRNGRLDAWGFSLQAMGYRARGELLDEYTALSRAARLNDSPLVKAALVRSLRAMGRTVEADTLRDVMRREMRTIHLRRRLLHPLLGPELALAFAVE